MIENKQAATYEWKDIGIVTVDTGKIIIADPANVLTHREFEELREKEKIAKLALFTDFKHGIVSKTGFGEGRYHIFAKIGDFGNMIKRITEIKIIFENEENNNDSQKIHEEPVKKLIITSEKKDDLSKGVKL
ncbi:MAG: hypothetical protein WA833_03065 [Nitrosotalea sp.]